jgi:P27 family predicted phage terminase small subunit
VAKDGRTGRPPKPTHLKVLSGDEERRINRDEPEPEPAELLGVDLKAPPRGIGARAAKVWRQYAPDLVDKHVLTTWDVALFESFCHAVADYHELRAKRRAHARDEYQHDAFTGIGSQGQLVRSPYWSAEQDALDRMMKLSTRFGLSPADRAGLVASPEAVGPGQVGAERLIN